MPGPWYFAWIEPDEVFDPDVHNRFDERVLSIAITHAEGDIPALTIALKNPRVGLLSSGRNVWAFLARDVAGVPTLEFKGRLIGIPSDLHKEAVTLEFTARPLDFVEQKEALADELRVLPYWDELWVTEDQSSPDTVLESRSALFHIDRRTLEVSISDVLQGEDDDITIENHLFSSLSVSYGQQPLRRIDITAEVTWDQEGKGDVDITDLIWQEFQTEGSPWNWPNVGSYTTDGLLDDWPKANDDLGGGWSMSPDAVAERAGLGFDDFKYQKVWTDQTQDTKDENLSLQQTVGTTGVNFLAANMATDGWVDWTAVFTVGQIRQKTILHYETKRNRTERATFSIEADVQPILVDPEGSDVETLEVSSDLVNKPVDPDGALPIQDLRRNCYFPTERGSKSLEHLMLLGRAKLRFRSRAVIMTFRMKGWVPDINCRRNIILVDDRLPGGQVSGKITAYTLFAKKAMYTDITIGCAIGNGVALPAAAGGDDVYADNYATGYTQREGAEVAVLAGELVYDPIDASVIDDDGVDFFNMVPGTVVTSLTVVNGPNAQQAVIDFETSKKGTAPDPIAALKDAATTVELILVPVDGGAFFTEYAVNVHPLVIPKLVDLEAA